MEKCKIIYLCVTFFIAGIFNANFFLSCNYLSAPYIADKGFSTNYFHKSLERCFFSLWLSFGTTMLFALATNNKLFEKAVFILLIIFYLGMAFNIIYCYFKEFKFHKSRNVDVKMDYKTWYNIFTISPNKFKKTKNNWDENNSVILYYTTKKSPCGYYTIGFNKFIDYFKVFLTFHQYIEDEELGVANREKVENVKRGNRALTNIIEDTQETIDGLRRQSQMEVNKALEEMKKCKNPITLNLTQKEKDE